MTNTTSYLRVDGARLRRSLEAMAEIGATHGGGMHRLTLSDDDRRARDLLVTWLEELRVRVAVDEMGNVFGRWPGRRDDLSPVITGSHLDTQPRGGWFDGVLGVMGALEVLRTLREYDVVTERPVVLVDWTNEEGSRFTPAMMASWRVGGRPGPRLGVGAHRRRRDSASGTSWRASATGARSPRARRPFHAYYELHIEQGPRLEQRGPRGSGCRAASCGWILVRRASSRGRPTRSGRRPWTAGATRW